MRYLAMFINDRVNNVLQMKLNNRLYLIITSPDWSRMGLEPIRDSKIVEPKNSLASEYGH